MNINSIILEIRLILLVNGQEQKNSESILVAIFFCYGQSKIYFADFRFLE